MPVIIKLTFPAGRYHATPWGRHVNEGVAEWPPSPWRLLRGLVAVWKRTCPTVPEDQVKRILTALLGPPAFHLPPHRVAHTRHAMPMNVIARNYKPSQAERKAGKWQGDPSIVFDTFVSVGRRATTFIGWPETDLPAPDRSVLGRLLANLSSLGRAESWVHAELTDEQPAWNCVPAPETDSNPVPVFCPDPATAFGAEHYPTLDAKKLSKGKLNPADFLWDCPRWHLCLDTETLHEKRRPTVPGEVGELHPAERGQPGGRETPSVAATCVHHRPLRHRRPGAAAGHRDPAPGRADAALPAGAVPTSRTPRRARPGRRRRLAALARVLGQGRERPAANRPRTRLLPAGR